MVASLGKRDVLISAQVTTMIKAYCRVLCLVLRSAHLATPSCSVFFLAWMSISISICRLGMSGARSPRHAQYLNNLITLTSSSVHHSSWLQRCYRITMSLKRPSLPKSDVKQWFTTTTTTICKRTSTVAGERFGARARWADLTRRFVMQANIMSARRTTMFLDKGTSDTPHSILRLTCLPVCPN